MRILVVEDEQKVANALREGLEGERYDVVVERTGEGAFFRVTTEPFDAVLLDLTLPGRDGLAILTAMRDRGIKAPVLVLTARDTLQDRVLGLDSGADDYLTKPFGVRELMARVRAVLRRRSVAPSLDADARQQPIAFKQIEMDPSRRRVRVRGEDVELTNQEFNLLYVLLSQPGIVQSREGLLRRAWPGDTFVTVRSVDTLVKRLRRKIEEDPANPALILTVWGTGYKTADA